MSENTKKVTIYLPKDYTIWIEDYAQKNQFSLSGAVRNLLINHINHCLKPVDLKVPDPFTGKEVLFDMEWARRMKQYEKDKKRKRDLAIEKAKAEGKIVDLKKDRD